MTPFETAARWHATYSHPSLFPVAIEAHAQVGIVHITPELFLLARPIHHTWKERNILNPWKTSKRPDTWHVWLFAGELKNVLPLVPYPLRFVTFHRHGEERIHLLKLKPLLKKLSPTGQ